MKKYLVSLLTGLSVVAASAALTTSVTVQPNTMTNLLSLNQSGYALVQAVAVTANSTNVSVSMYDVTTNSFQVVTPAYTNLLSYATNYIVSWTNYYGTVNSWTNISLVDVTNSVAATTNAAAAKLAVAALANTTTTITPLAMNIQNGLWITNSSSGIATVSIQYRQ